MLKAPEPAGLPVQAGVGTPRVGIVILAAAGTVRFSNAEARRLLPQVLERARPHFAPPIRALLEKVRAHRAYAAVRLRRGAPASRRRVLCSAEPYGDPESGALLLCIVEQRAVRLGSERRRLEALLRVQEERLRILMDNVSDHAILMVDPTGLITSWNAAAERITGYAAEEMVGRPLVKLFPDAEVAAAELGLRSAREHGRHEAESWHVRKDGSRIRVNVITTALSNPTGRVIGFARVVHDLSERIAAEDALRSSEEQLRHAQKFENVGLLASGIAHDFNNMLTAIRGHAQLLAEDLEPGSPSHGDAEEIRRAADRCAALTRQLLTFSRRQPVQPVLLEVNDVIVDVCELSRRLIRRQIEITTSLADGLWPIYADRGHIEQIVMNLLVNARDAIGGGGRIRVQTRNVAFTDAQDYGGQHLEAGDYVQIAVSDNGTGIERAVLERIFEPFFTTKPEGQGTGLGLTTVYSIVQQNDGRVSVYSEVGHGTAFKIHLPRAAPARQRGAVRVPARGAHRQGVVLIAEDDASTRAFAASVLAAAGYEVIEAPTGEAARQAAADRSAIDLLLADVIMPETTGRRLAERLQRMLPATHTLFMSGFSHEDAIAHGLLDADAEFIEKPFSAGALISRVDALLG